MRRLRFGIPLGRVGPNHLLDIVGAIEVCRTGCDVAMPLLLIGSSNDKVEVVLKGFFGRVDPHYGV